MIQDHHGSPDGFIAAIDIIEKGGVKGQQDTTSRFLILEIADNHNTSSMDCYNGFDDFVDTTDSLLHAASARNAVDAALQKGWGLRGADGANFLAGGHGANPAARQNHIVGNLKRIFEKSAGCIVVYGTHHVSGNAFYHPLYYGLTNGKNTANDPQIKCYQVNMAAGNIGGNSNRPIKIYTIPRNKLMNIPNIETRKNRR